MITTLQGNDVRTELYGSVLYFRARDLLAMVLNSANNSQKTSLNRIKRRGFLTFYNNVEKGRSSRALYIQIEDVTNFLDSINSITSMKTICLMQEFMQQFKRNLQ